MQVVDVNTIALSQRNLALSHCTWCRYLARMDVRRYKRSGPAGIPALSATTGGSSASALSTEAPSSAQENTHEQRAARRAVTEAAQELHLKLIAQSACGPDQDEGHDARVAARVAAERAQAQDVGMPVSALVQVGPVSTPAPAPAPAPAPVLVLPLSKVEAVSQADAVMAEAAHALRAAARAKHDAAQQLEVLPKGTPVPDAALSADEEAHLRRAVARANAEKAVRQSASRVSSTGSQPVAQPVSTAAPPSSTLSTVASMSTEAALPSSGLTQLSANPVDDLAMPPPPPLSMPSLKRRLTPFHHPSPPP